MKITVTASLMLPVAESQFQLWPFFLFVVNPQTLPAICTWKTTLLVLYTRFRSDPKKIQKQSSSNPQQEQFQLEMKNQNKRFWQVNKAGSSFLQHSCEIQECTFIAPGDRRPCLHSFVFKTLKVTIIVTYCIMFELECCFLGDTVLQWLTDCQLKVVSLGPMSEVLWVR